MDTINLYMKATHMLMNVDLTSKETYVELTELVPQLHQLLSCTVCTKLLTVPYSTLSKCQHHVCKDCLTPNLKLNCKTCDEAKYYSNESVRLLLQCYKTFCSLFINSELYKSLIEDKEFGLEAGEKNKGILLECVQQGASVSDKFILDDTTPSPMKFCSLLSDCKSEIENGEQHATQGTEDGKKDSRKRTRKTIKKTPSKRKPKKDSKEQPILKNKKPNRKITKNPVEIPEEYLPDHVRAKRNRSRRYRRLLNKRHLNGCRCGTTISNPGILTCCGQRCPCYAEGKPCDGCGCNGCRNTHTASGMKVIKLMEEKIHSYDTEQEVNDDDYHMPSTSNYSDFNIDESPGGLDINEVDIVDEEDPFSFLHNGFNEPPGGMFRMIERNALGIALTANHEDENI